MNYVRHDEETSHKIDKNNQSPYNCYSIIMFGCFFIAKTSDCIFPNLPKVTLHKQGTLPHLGFRRYVDDVLHLIYSQLFYTLHFSDSTKSLHHVSTPSYEGHAAPALRHLMEKIHSETDFDKWILVYQQPFQLPNVGQSQQQFWIRLLSNRQESPSAFMSR